MKVINCFIICQILYVDLTFEISFYHDVFFDFVWWKTLECYIHRALRRARWIDVIFTARYVAWGECNVLSKNVSRDVSKSEDIFWSHIIKLDMYLKWIKNWILNHLLYFFFVYKWDLVLCMFLEYEEFEETKGVIRIRK